MLRLLLRPLLVFVLAFLIGYWVGFSDAFRGEQTLGARVGTLLGRVHPDEVRAKHEERTQKLRRSIRPADADIVP